MFFLIFTISLVVIVFLKKNQKENPISNYKMYITIASIAAVFSLVIAIASINSKNENTSEEFFTEEISTEIQTSETEIHEEKELSFNDSLLLYLDEEICNEAIDIIENQIGFTDIYFKRKEGTGNYYFNANGYDICMIAYSEDAVYKIFIPNSSYTFYEEGKLIQTYEDFNMKVITQDEMSRSWIIAEEIIKNNLKNPRSAKFPSLLTSDDIYFQKYGNMIAVKSYVNAENSFGGNVKSTFIVEFVVNDWEMFEYEILYIKIDNDSYGTWVELN